MKQLLVRSLLLVGLTTTAVIKSSDNNETIIRKIYNQLVSINKINGANLVDDDVTNFLEDIKAGNGDEINHHTITVRDFATGNRLEEYDIMIAFDDEGENIEEAILSRRLFNGHPEYNKPQRWKKIDLFKKEELAPLEECEFN